MTTAEFEVTCCLFDGCRDEEELMSVYESFRENDVSFDQLMKRLESKGLVYSMGRLKPGLPELFQITDSGLKACSEYVFHDSSLKRTQQSKECY